MSGIVNFCSHCVAGTTGWRSAGHGSSADHCWRISRSTELNFPRKSALRILISRVGAGKSRSVSISNFTASRLGTGSAFKCSMTLRSAVFWLEGSALNLRYRPNQFSRCCGVNESRRARLDTVARHCSGTPERPHGSGHSESGPSHSEPQFPFRRHGKQD